MIRGVELSGMMAKQQARDHRLVAVDLFCGVGGLTHGLVRAGIPVSVGIDLDPACKYPFEANNKSEFILSDVADIKGTDLMAAYPTDAVRVLVGCTPCQQFSRYARRRDRKDTQKWRPLEHFSRLVAEVRPEVVSMENVPELTRDDIFRYFIAELAALGYHTSYNAAFCPDYGIPQHRTRLVLLASMRGKISLLPPTHSPKDYRTVKHAISKMRPLECGQVDPNDPLHRACDLSDLNTERIRSSLQGGSWRDWPKHLVAKCHRKDSGETYPSVYGRMEWNKPSPTITTQFFGFGNGRFGHPVQDRAISLREGSILQSFPKGYRFCPKGTEVSFAVLGRLIGNAVPVRLGEIIGKSILQHVRESNG